MIPARLVIPMFTDRRDYLLDMIQQMMERLAAILQRAQGHTVEQAELERECARAMDDEFAEIDRRMRDLEPRMVAHLVRPVERLRAYALLLSARALLHSRRATLEGRSPPEVEPAARRALSLVLEAIIASEPMPADLDAVRMMFPLVDDGQLSPRYLEALIGLSADS